MRFPAPAALLAATLALAACSAAGLVDALTPGSGYTVETGLAYGPDPRQRLDVYRPATPADGTAPRTIIFFYGGGWESGARAGYRFVAQALAARGYAVAVPDYRLYPQVRYPAFLEDAAAAVAWVERNGPAHGLPGGPVALLGHSAGAYIAVMLAVDGRWLTAAGAGPPCAALSAAVGLAGPYDFLPLTSPTLMEIFGPEETRPQTQPITHADGTAPPLLLLTGRRDKTVRPENSLRMAARVRERGGTARSLLYDGVGHGALIGAFAWPLRWLAPVLDDVDAFLRQPAESVCRDRFRAGTES